MFINIIVRFLIIWHIKRENMNKCPQTGKWLQTGTFTLYISTTSQSQAIDVSLTMATVLECMTLRQSTSHIPQFDGRSPPLRELIENVPNRAVYITPHNEPGFIKVVLRIIMGAACESVRNKRFDGTSYCIAAWWNRPRHCDITVTIAVSCCPCTMCLYFRMKLGRVHISLLSSPNPEG